MSSKIERFINSFRGIEPNRIGKCNPSACQTLDGKRGAACCKIEYVCPFVLPDHQCCLYELRPINCFTFPRSEEDLKLVKYCTYSFK
jgi:hypothetical protein